MHPKTRNEVITLAKKLFTRVMAPFSSQPHTAVASEKSQMRSDITSSNRIDVVAEKTESGQNMTAALEQHMSFLRWYTSFLVSELQPTATFQRHITALQVLLYILHHRTRIQPKTLSNPLALVNQEGNPQAVPYDHILIRSLLDLVMDPFDDVRTSASQCLQSVLQSPRDGIVLLRNLERARSLMRATGRADHADGFSRVCQIVYGLQLLHPEGLSGNAVSTNQLVSFLRADVEVARSDLHLAVRTAPLHGHLIALRYVSYHDLV